MRLAFVRWPLVFGFLASLVVMLEVAAIAEPQPPQTENAPDGSAHLLRYRFAKDQIVHYDVVHKMSITTRKAEASETATNESKSRKHYRVMSVDDHETGLLECYLDKVHLTARFGENEPDVFDSESPTNSKKFARVSESIGKPLARLEIAPNGRLIKVDPLIAGESPESADASRSFLVVFPETPIKVGESWTDSLVVKVHITPKLTQNVTLGRKYTLESVEGDVATIRMAMRVLTPVQDEAIRCQLIQRTPSGTIQFDMQRGLILARELTSDNRVIGFAGDDSSMHAISHLTEQIVLTPAVADR